MAAFSFFRRRQKMVLLVMVLLMVAFLIPSAIQGLGKDKTLDAAVGHIGKEEITVRMIQAAEVDLRLLRGSLQLGLFRTPRMGEVEFLIFFQYNKDRVLTWALLLHEARGMGITITESQIDVFLADSGLTGEAYKRELANLRLNKYTEKHLRRAVADYLTVITAMSMVAVNTPPSLPELRHTWRDLRERIQLATVAFEAEEFTDKAPEPAKEAVEKWFDKYKHLTPRDPSNRTDFGFGYRRPDRLEVTWLFMDRDNVARAVEPSERQMMDYWRRHKGELKKKVPIPTTSPAPASTQPAEPPAVSPAEPEFREVVIEKYSQAKPQIRQILRDQDVKARMNDLVSLTQQVVGRFDQAEKPYAAAAAAMIRPADDLLSRKVAPLPFTKAPLETVIEQLEDLAKVKIVYPVGQHDKLSLDAKLIVNLGRRRNDISLGEALERIRKKVKFPPIKWVTCNGFENVIFPSEPVNLVPISAGRTGMVGFEKVARHELLGLARQSPGEQTGRNLLSIAATAEAFQGPVPQRAPLIEIGGEFSQAMYVSGRQRGRLLWRLAGAEAAHTPQQLTDDIRKQVVRDIKIAAGFKKALAAAEALKAKADKKGDPLEKIVKDKKRKVEKTELFSRKTMHFQTGRMFWSFVPGVGINPKFIETVFQLAPSDPDGPHTDRPVAVAPLYRARKVMLVQRIGYEPASAEIFDGVGAQIITQTILGQRRQREVMGWFFGENVARRVEYRPRS